MEEGVASIREKETKRINAKDEGGFKRESRKKQMPQRKLKRHRNGKIRAKKAMGVLKKRASRRTEKGERVDLVKRARETPDAQVHHWDAHISRRELAGSSVAGPSRTAAVGDISNLCLACVRPCEIFTLWHAIVVCVSQFYSLFLTFCLHSPASP